MKAVERMEQVLKKALGLRTEKNYGESNQLLQQLAADFPDDPFVHYQCAWSYDVLGKEAQAVPYYEKAIRLGLQGKDMEGAFIGLGSTYRTLGKYQKSKEVITDALEMFPENRAMQAFLAMALYNLGDFAKAMELMLTCLTETSEDEDIKAYKKALRFYADKLDQVWE
ncbi:tetratricopeptide repeat protein [Planococcus sp. YIM B11945]|uniref:tetratricopeptide repeat protein n=1 Tax=Planococcus sp. YIM B11945 TaxID=3435410 RepID=UPI003D7C931F